MAGRQGGAVNLLPVTGMLAGTLTKQSAATRRYRVVVVGAGPAGAALTLRLARIGQRVLLVDRESMPRGKVCGCCLSPAARAELGALAPGDPADDRFQAISRAMVELTSVSLSAGGRSARLSFPGGAVLSRERLDTALVQAAVDAGADWLPRTAVASIDVTDAGVKIVIGSPGSAEGDSVSIQADACVLATGLVDQVRVHGMALDTGPRGALDHPRRCLIGLGCTLPAGGRALPPGQLAMAVGPQGYCGMVRLEDGRIDIAAAIDRRAVRAVGGPAEAVRQLLDAAGDADLKTATMEQIRSTVFRATPPVTRTAAAVSAGGRLLRVGDAAAYVEPFTGEGIGWALASARLLAEAFAASPGGDAGAIGQTYAESHHHHFGSRLSRCRRVAALLRRPRLVSAAVVSAGLLPWAAGRMVPFLTGANLSRGGA